ncbi:hypothetical protein [Saccharopolyspora sp. NPDC049426]|uniref:hypothetical protein n=1 Tax=Saccharopolyspora sp. NPDC049426 TaxID=3155652 RepID=UPI00342952F9
MALVTVLSAKGSPGVTTGIAALATVWPDRLLVVDADPAGGDLLPGWAGQWWVDGRLTSDRSVLSFASSTRHLESVPAEGLAGHAQEVPDSTGLRLLAGVNDPVQAGAIGSDGWKRLASALRDLSGSGPDVLVDAGRWSPATPWPLVAESDLVLVGVRPTLRHIVAADRLVRVLRDLVPSQRLGAAVSVATSRQADDAARALAIPVGMELPDDPTAAGALCDGGTPCLQPRRSALLRTSRKAARRLHTQLAGPGQVSSAPASDEGQEQVA